MNTKKHFIKFAFFVIVAIFSMASTSWSATYYVDATNGDNGNHGLSETKAWKTIKKVNISNFNPGDSILFKRGEIWKEMLTVPDAGQSGNPIIFGAYGSGNKPIITGKDYISGWDTSSNWSAYPNNIWSFSCTANPRRIWLSGVEYKRAKTIADVDSTSRWYRDDKNQTLYVHATSNPANFYSNAEAAYLNTARRSSIKIVEKNYITVQDLDLQGGYNALSILGSSYVIIENCNIGLYTGHSGIHVMSSGAKQSHSCEIRNNFMDSGTRLSHDWEARLGYHGIELINGAQYCKIYGNSIIDWEHGGIFLQSANASLPVSYNKIYDNFITTPDLDYGRAFSTSAIVDTETLGICAYNEFYKNYVKDTRTRSQFGGNHNIIHHNVFDTMPDVSWHTAEEAISLEPVSGICMYNKIYNNTIYNTYREGIVIQGSGEGAPNRVHSNEIINNIIYMTTPYSGIRIKSQDTIGSNTYKNNLFYNPNYINVVEYKGYRMTTDEFNNKNGDNNIILSTYGNIDPLFSNSTSADFTLRPNSTCIGAGIDVGLAEDYNNTPIPQNSVPDIGAFQSNSSTILPVQNLRIVQWTP